MTTPTYREIKIGFGGDCINPVWPSRLTKQVHDWRTYVTMELRQSWWTLNWSQREMVARAFEVVAQAEDWD